MALSLEKIAAEVSTTLIKDFCTKALASVSDPISKNMSKITTDFNQHLTKNYVRNKYVRILCNKAEPIPLDSIYVSGEFSCGQKTVDDLGLMQIVRDNQKVIIKGDGGLGKTFFVKKLWSALFDESGGRIPVFIPLRELNEHSDLSLQDFVRLTILPAARHSTSTFEYFCKRGDFVFLFDGFDEVVESKRDKLKSQLIQLTRNFNNCGYLISTRETGAFNAWEDFNEFSVHRSSREQIVNMLKKVPYSGNKQKFIKKITKAYFEENESFLSNPLLAIMMMITFNDNPQSSGKKSIFYENAFQTLYSLHDGLKEAYERERSLDKDTFRKVFSHFCLFTYYNEEISFSENDFRRYIKKTLNYLNIEADTDEVIKEFCESTNLMQIEGLDFSFIHRSFQEYFAASCATKELTRNVSDFLNEFHNRLYDDTFDLAYEIHPKLVEKEFFIPKLEYLKEQKLLPRTVSNSKFPFHFLFAADVNFLLTLRVTSTGRRFYFLQINSGSKRTLQLIDRLSHSIGNRGTDEFYAIFQKRRILFSKYSSANYKLNEKETKKIESNNNGSRKRYSSKVLARFTFSRETLKASLSNKEIFSKHPSASDLKSELKSTFVMLNNELKAVCYNIRDANLELIKEHENSRKSLEELLSDLE